MRTARFVSNKVIEIQAGDEKEELTAETIINVLVLFQNVLPIPELAENKFAVDSTGAFNVWKTYLTVSQSGGPIGLEFARISL